MAATPARRGVRRVQALKPAPRIALTSGEPAGIGPELCAALSRLDLPCELVVYGDRGLIAERARALGHTIELRDYSPQRRAPHAPGTLTIAHQPLAAAAVAGKLDVRNASYVLGLVDAALSATVTHEFDAMVTAPLQKSVINDAGIAFKGHTEYLAAHTGIHLPVMLLVAGTLRVALATTHLPLRAVSDAITLGLLREVIDVLAVDLARHFGLAKPRIAVCGVNPHAGESGHFGREEIEVIAPAIEDARSRGIDVVGPLPADTAFVPSQLERFDAVLAMFHDQGLPVLKHAGFGRAVNVTLGLPVIRTSVDHGTALDLAGTGRADAGSLEQAVHLAIDMANRRR